MSNECEYYKTYTDWKHEEIGFCAGTDDRKTCFCGGDPLNCTFFNLKRYHEMHSKLDTIPSDSINRRDLLDHLLKKAVNDPDKTFPYWVWKEVKEHVDHV